MVWYGQGDRSNITNNHNTITMCLQVCRAGICTTYNGTLTAVNGGWSSWDETPEDKCGGINCGTCYVTGQIRVQVRVQQHFFHYSRIVDTHSFMQQSLSQQRRHTMRR